MKGQLQLFDINKLLKRPTPDQTEFEKTNYDFLIMLPELIDKAFKMTRKEASNKTPLSMNFSWFANSMNGNLLSIIAEQYPEWVKATGRKSYKIMLPPNYECYIKKLTAGGLLPSYNHSNTSAAMCELRAMPEQELLPVIFLGYEINDTNDAILGYHAVCIKGIERIWTTDLTSIETITAPVFVQENETVSPKVFVKLKNVKKAK